MTRGYRESIPDSKHQSTTKDDAILGDATKRTILIVQTSSPQSRKLHLRRQLGGGNMGFVTGLPVLKRHQIKAMPGCEKTLAIEKSRSEASACNIPIQI